MATNDSLSMYKYVWLPVRTSVCVSAYVATSACLGLYERGADYLDTILFIQGLVDYSIVYLC